MEIVMKRIEDIIPYENNPRRNDDAVEYVANSIREFGFKVPIVIDKENVIVAGHTRLKASEQLGLKEVPCIVADDLTEDQIKAFRLADNKVGEIASWDFGKLEMELEDINLDMGSFGFLDTELINPNDLDTAEITEDEPPKEIETRCKIGDLWQLGEHKLICGNSTDTEVIGRLMDGTKSDIAFTSPPYNVGNSAKLNGNTHMTECKYENGNDDLDNYDELLIGVTDNMLMFSKWAFINLQMLANNKRVICEWLNNYRDSLCDIAIWYKTATAPAMAERVMNSQFEFVFVFSNDNNSRAIGTKTFRALCQMCIKDPHREKTNMQKYIPQHSH